ncbi:MAG TPA: hypothetical protein VE863_12105 [Pyrinomonadaceae bacterium]|jgi:hypothetical protein|nr:hypothetical protein [Pyrinomonadaceae bacterium]
MPTFFKQIPWRRFIVIAFGALVSYLLIPMIGARYNDIKSLREARRTRAMRFEDHDNEFTDKVNEVGDLMTAFNDHAHRMKLSGIELKEAQNELTKNHLERSLNIGVTRFWPMDFHREASELELLSPDQLKQLDAYIKDYEKSLEATTDATEPLWQFIDSSEYRVDDESQKKIDAMKTEMNKELEAQEDIRAGLVAKISTLFVNSNFRTGTLNMLGF